MIGLIYEDGQEFNLAKKIFNWLKEKKILLKVFFKQIYIYNWNRYIFALFGILIGAWINKNQSGSIADWVSAVMSFLAICAVYWQVNREINN